MKYLISLLLVMLLVGTCLLGCQNHHASTAGSDDSSARPSNMSGHGYTADVPQKNYDGAEFTIMCRARDCLLWGEQAIFADGTETSVLGNAAYRRNDSVQEQLGIVLNVEEINTDLSGDVFYQILFENATAYDDIADICIPGIYDAAMLSAMGIFVNLHEVPYVDLEQPWWQKSLNDSIAILGKQYFAINDMLLNDKLDTYVLFFNKNIMDDRDLAYPYELVDKMEWTIDQFYTYIKDFGIDSNYNNQKDAEDTYGMVYLMSDCFFVGAGITGASLDADGIPQMNEFSERVQNVYEKMLKVRNDYTYNTWGFGHDGMTGDEDQTYMDIYGERSMFMCGALGKYQTVISHLESDNGVVPMPLLDENQTEYIGRAGFYGATCITVLTSTGDKERAGIVLETMSAESKNIISPAFFETLLTDRYAQDEESKRMIALVIESEIFDLDQIYSWGNMIASLENLVKQGNNNPATLYARLLIPAKTKLQGTLDTYANMNS